MKKATKPPEAEEIIYEKGVLRLSARQLRVLCRELAGRCGADDVIDVQRPENFTAAPAWSLYRRATATGPPARRNIKKALVS